MYVELFKTQVIDPFINAIRARNQQTPVVLLLDNVDALPQKVSERFQKDIIIPLVSAGKSRFVATSAFGAPWRDYVKRRHSLEERLEPFTREMVGQQLRLQNTEWEDYTGEVFGLTGGYPVMTASLVGFMQEMIERGEELSMKSFQKHKTEWMNRLVNEVVDGVILEKASPRVIQALKVLANLPGFGPETISQIIPANVSEYSGPLSSSVTGEIRSQPVVHWSDSLHLYYLEPALQRLLRAHLKMTDPARYREIHRQAACIYDNNLKGWEQDYRQDGEETGLRELKGMFSHDLEKIGQCDIWEAISLITQKYERSEYLGFALDYFQAAYHHRAAYYLRREPAN